jgi:hypothetical protein
MNLPYRIFTFHIPNLMLIFLCLGYSKESISVQSHKTIQNELFILFWGVASPTPWLEDHSIISFSHNKMSLII